MNKKELKEKYNINDVAGGQFEAGFFACLDAIDRGIIKKRVNGAIKKRD